MCDPITLGAVSSITAAQAATASLVIQGVSAMVQAAAASDVANKKNQAYIENLSLIHI